MAARGRIINSAKSIPGGARPTPAPQASGGPNFGALSPLTQQLDSGGSGWGQTYSGYLPRPTQTFTEGAFGPFSPILPVPVDAPADGSDFPDARLFQYEVGWNLPVGQPGTENIKLADFNTLRTLADLYSVARSCIQLRKAEIRGLEWDVMPTPDASKAMRSDRGAMKDFGSRRAEAMRFFRQPDPDYFTWGSFIDALLEEVFVTDALSLLFRMKWAKGNGKGLLGSDLDSLNLISGSTIRPLLGLHGEKPAPPAPAYQQYLYGVPRSDYQALLTGQDILSGNLSGAEMNAYKADQMLYLPMVPRRWTPYGFPPIERALVPVMAGLQKQGYQLDYFREGTVPAVYISPGDANQMTPNQIRELQDALNAIAGDPAWKHKIIVLPSGSKVDPQRSPQLADQFDDIVMTQVCCVPGTDVVTKRGLVKIEDVRVGDEVITHTGMWRPILAKFKNARGDRTVRKLTANGLDPLEVTDNHKMRVAQFGQTASHRSVYRQTEWVPSSDLKAKRTRGNFDALTVPVPVMGDTDAKLTVDWSRVRSGYKYFSSVVHLGADLGGLLGLYMAEGFQSTGGQVCWIFHENETDLHAQVQGALKSVFGLESRFKRNEKNHTVTVVADSVVLADLLGEGTARTKKLPDWAWDGSPEFYRALFDGWIAGDGCERANGWRGYTSSKSLAWHMRLVALALGYAPQLRTQKQPATSIIDGRKINGLEHIWVVEVIRDRVRSDVYRVDGDAMSSPLRSNEESEYADDVVWNLNVQGDHSYLTTGGMAANCMAFDVQPMELGITPGRSSSMGAHNQMAKQSQGSQERKATKPTLKFLGSIMDAVLQGVCKQDDMRFVFEGLEESEDENEQTQMLVSQVGASLRSIDEAREVLNLQPWGLPETSDPGWATATGWIPLQQAITAHATNSTMGALLEAQPGASMVPPTPPAGGAPGGSGSSPAKPSGPNGDQSPAHDAADSADAQNGKSTQKSDSRRDDSVSGASDAVAVRLKEIVDQYQSGKLAAPTALNTAVSVLASGYGAVMADAVRHAQADHGLSKAAQTAPSADTTGAAMAMAEAQRSWLMGLLQDVANAAATGLSRLTSRLGLYGRSLNTAYNKTYGQEVQKSPDTYQIIWKIGETEHCPLCLARDGKSFTFDTLPGWPGDGGFGALCEGGPNCGCSLDYVKDDVVLGTADNPGREAAIGYYTQQLKDIETRRENAVQEREEFLSTVPEPARSRAMTRDQIRQELADLENQRIRESGGYPGVSAEPSDISAHDVLAEMQRRGISKAEEAEIGALVRHVKKGRDVSTWTLRHLDRDFLARVTEHMAKGLDVETAVSVVKASRTVSDLTAAGGGGRQVTPHTADGIELPPGAKTDDEDPHWRNDPAPEAETVGSTPVRPRDASGNQTGGDNGSGPHAATEDPAEGNDASMPPSRGIPSPQGGGPVNGEAPWPQGGPGTGQAGVGKAETPFHLQPATAEDAKSHMGEKFPADSLVWMNDAEWFGPGSVPVDMVDTQDEASWVASKDTDKVQDFRDKIKAGHALTPIVGVLEPGESKVKIIDGHHRFEAYQQEDSPSAVMYVGRVNRADGPWDETHSFQKSSAPDTVKVGPKGYEHGWIFVGVPGVGDHVFHPHHGHGTVTDKKLGTVTVRFHKDGSHKDFLTRSPNRENTKTDTDPGFVPEDHTVWMSPDGVKVPVTGGTLEQRKSIHTALNHATRGVDKERVAKLSAVHLKGQDEGWFGEKGFERALAVYVPDSREIHMNADAVFKPGRDEAHHRMELSGWFTESGAEGAPGSGVTNVLTHEFGHHLDFSASHEERVEIRQRLADELGIGYADFQSGKEGVKLKDGTKYQASPGAISTMAARVSVYGSTNGDEMMAELWAQRQGSYGHHQLPSVLGDYFGGSPARRTGN